MKINNTLNIGLEGFNKSQNLLNKTSSNIASLNNKESNVNLNQEAVNLIKAETYGKANAKVIQTSNDILGTLIDIKA